MVNFNTARGENSGGVMAASSRARAGTGEKAEALCPRAAVAVLADLERTEQGTEDNDGHQRNHRADDTDHHDIKIAFLVGGTADG